MKNYWFIREKETHLIAVTSDHLVSGNIKNHIELNLIIELDKGEFPKDIFSVPFSYIKTIENHVNSKRIVINYSKDSSHIIEINDSNVKSDVFNLLREKLTKFSYSENTPSIFKHVKAQIFALIILTCIFIGVYKLAHDISNGTHYQAHGGSKGYSDIFLGLAQFGTFKVIAVYSILITITFLALFRKLKNRSLIKYLKRKER